MRLGQLSRKLAMRPAEIVAFLAKRSILIEDGSNTRLQNEHVAMIMEQFAPALLEEVMTEQDEEIPAAVAVPAVEEIKVNVPVYPVESERSTENSDKTEERVEVIKAQKVELPGLKVLGKIEFPEPKKKEPPAVEVANITANDPPVKNEIKDQVKRPKPENRNWNLPRSDRRDQRPKKNPIALAREQEAREIELKRKAEAERKKELRTQHYFKKVKPSAPTKAMKLVNDEVEEISAEQSNPPKTRLGRFFKWLTT